MAAARWRKVRPYDARHACLTYLAANGVPLHIVAAWAVTATARDGAGHYLHPNITDMGQGSDILAELFG